ncbi:hypothetical protein [Chlamydia suis]|uniref:hypothetical protein n=1 Tax=Chlamydia suis TaxID=83559 RepID=UPI0009B14594|nr:hypothetical protein [Chlamydia suis]MDD6310084.1 hypothetical protein [Chlamydia suis]MEB2689937.1 hypothetical protein [Chlamydia suis]
METPDYKLKIRLKKATNIQEKVILLDLQKKGTIADPTFYANDIHPLYPKTAERHFLEKNLLTKYLFVVFFSKKSKTKNAKKTHKFFRTIYYF